MATSPHEQKINELYERRKTEFNYGHNKEDHMAALEVDPMTQFANQDFYVNMYREVFDHYGLPFEWSFLDVWASMGGTLYSVEKTGKFDFLAGIDIDGTAIDMAIEYKKMKGIENVDMKTIDGFFYPYEDNTFDVVFVKDVIEHVENMDNMQSLINEVHRVTKPWGYVFVEAPNYFYPHETHLSIPKFPYWSNKAILRATAGFFNKNVDFVQQLNFVNPINTKRRFETKFSNCIDVYYDYRIQWKLSQENITIGRKWIDSILNLIKKRWLNTLAGNILRHTRLYPSMWMIAIK